MSPAKHLSFPLFGIRGGTKGGVTRRKGKLRQNIDAGADLQSVIDVWGKRNIHAHKKVTFDYYYRLFFLTSKHMSPVKKLAPVESYTAQKKPSRTRKFFLFQKL